MWTHRYSKARRKAEFTVSLCCCFTLQRRIEFLVYLRYCFTIERRVEFIVYLRCCLKQPLPWRSAPHNTSRPSFLWWDAVWYDGEKWRLTTVLLYKLPLYVPARRVGHLLPTSVTISTCMPRLYVNGCKNKASLSPHFSRRWSPISWNVLWPPSCGGKTADPDVVCTCARAPWGVFDVTQSQTIRYKTTLIAYRKSRFCW